MVEEVVTVTKIYIEPKAAQPTQDSTKDFTEKMDTATVGGKSRNNMTIKPYRTEVDLFYIKNL